VERRRSEVHQPLIDALQIAAAVEVAADAFLTNDIRLKKIKEIKILVLKDYIHP
jgi:predicted nucleic acid-binding protein